MKKKLSEPELAIDVIIIPEHAGKLKVIKKSILKIWNPGKQSWKN